MYQTFSGAVLLGAVLLCAVVLFVIALAMKPKTSASKQNNGTGSKAGLNKVKPKSWNKLKTNTKAKFNGKTQSNKANIASSKTKFNSKVGAFGKASNTQLLKLKNKISKNFPDFNALLREHHLVLERNAKKVALLTLDANAALGRRRLGEVTVINFHTLPSIEELRIELSGV